MKLTVLGIIVLIAISAASHAKTCFEGVRELSDQILDRQESVVIRGYVGMDDCEVRISRSEENNDEILLTVKSEHGMNKVLLNQTELLDQNCKTSKNGRETELKFNQDDMNYKLDIKDSDERNLEFVLVKKPAGFKNSLVPSRKATCEISL